MFEHITKEFIRTHQFQAEVPTVKPPAQSFRLMSARNLPPTDTELQLELRGKFVEIMATTFKKNYAELESRCYISEAAMRKYLNGRRPINTFVVARFCVGARLSLEKTCELFKLCGHILSPEVYRLDAIVVDTLKCGETIQDFYEVTKAYGLDEIWKSWDKLSNTS